MDQRRIQLSSLFFALPLLAAMAPLQANPASEEGVASYYSDRFDGRRTASGQRFDKNGLTAAHRTLDFGTRVRVTNKANGRSVEVVINDRGPHARNRAIDLSKGAAREIGMIGAGVARVEMEVLERGSTPLLASNQEAERRQRLMMELF